MTSIRHDDIQVGDWLTGPIFSSERHGVVAAIRPYRCGIPGHEPRTCEHAAWRYIAYQDGTEVTITPGGSWPGERRAVAS